MSSPPSSNCETRAIVAASRGRRDRPPLLHAVEVDMIRIRAPPAGSARCCVSARNGAAMEDRHDQSGGAHHPAYLSRRPGRRLRHRGRRGTGRVPDRATGRLEFRSNRLGGAWSLLSLGAFFGSGIAASTFFLARAWPWALILGALPLLVTGWLGPVPALALFMGALWGNVLILRRRGLTASRPAGSSRLVVRIFMWLALIILFFSFYALFSRQGARHDRVDRRPMKKPLR